MADDTFGAKLKSAMANAMAMRDKALKHGDTILADMLSVTIARMRSFMGQLRVNP